MIPMLLKPDEEKVQSSDDSDDDRNNYVLYDKVNQRCLTMDNIQSTANAINTEQCQLQQCFIEWSTGWLSHYPPPLQQ